MKIKRFIEWARVMRSEFKTWELPIKAVKLAAFWVKSEPATKAEWQRRVRACARCPVYDPQAKACRRGQWGCGCYIPFKAAAEESKCWADEVGVEGVGSWEVEDSGKDR